MSTKELSRRELMKWGGAAVASIPLGTLESIISGSRNGASAHLDLHARRDTLRKQCLKAEEANDVQIPSEDEPKISPA